MDLSQKHCVPCEGGAKPLSVDQAKEYLSGLSGWIMNQSGTEITKRYNFKNFMYVMSFVNQVAEVAESEGHHPDICLGYDYIDIKLQTHAIKGLSENDFILASKINSIKQ